MTLRPRTQPPVKQDCRCQVKSWLVARKMPRETVERLAEAWRPAAYQPGNILFYQGNQPLAIHFVCAGRVKLVRCEGSGRQRIVRIVSAPEVLGERALLADQPYAATAEVTEDAHICQVDAVRFQKLWAQDPELPRFFARLLAEKLGEADENGSDLALRTIRERLAKLIVELHDAVPGPGAPLALPESRQDLADLLGTAPEVVSRVLAELCEKRLIALAGRSIRVIELSRLRAAARMGGNGGCALSRDMT